MRQFLRRQFRRRRQYRDVLLRMPFVHVEEDFSYIDHLQVVLGGLGGGDVLLGGLGGLIGADDLHGSGLDLHAGSGVALG